MRRVERWEQKSDHRKLELERRLLIFPSRWRHPADNGWRAGADWKNVCLRSSQTEGGQSCQDTREVPPWCFLHCGVRKRVCVLTLKI